MKITPTPEEQIWTVVQAIANSHEISASNAMLLIDPRQLSKVVSEVELKQILNKLERDDKLIEIHRRPDDLILGDDSHCYGVIIPDHEVFREFLNRAHSLHYGDVNRLAAENFFAVCDVAMDIVTELQLALAGEGGVSIAIVPSIIRFNILLPAKSPGLLERYGNYRMKALGYMRDRGHIEGYNLRNDMTSGRWDQEIDVQVDRYNFDKFYKRLMDAYQRRVVEPEKAKQAGLPKKEGPPATTVKTQPLPDNLSVAVKDRQIWVNDFILSKPHAVGGNKGFFDYLYGNAGVPIARDAIPDYAKSEVGNKSFSKVLNALGFKGEILKAFCPERGKSKVLFRKEVTTEQLEDEGINLELLSQELRLAHTKNSPK